MRGSDGRAAADLCGPPVLCVLGLGRRGDTCSGEPPAVVSGARWGRRGAVPFLPSPWPLFLAEEACVRSPLQKQQSLPLRPVIPLVARISDQNASGAPPMTVREKTRLEKFRQLLSSHNTDLGEWQRGRLWAGRRRQRGDPWKKHGYRLKQRLLQAGKSSCQQCYKRGSCRNRSVGR